ncbi:hypothetical protein NM688_g1959 [Phlebia brevispora]|uniref:Uncharacterized protein n=1 Tax=Phlebia brevispora TaxID=194682 RepID=A0ACC1TAC7_9APHY|nr:hypothetical protein NM688_g1959 [Phlebia brevispora]
MFSTAVQPTLLSLFSSTGSDPLSLFSSHTDSSLPADSFVCLLDDTASEPSPPSPPKLILPPTIQQDRDGGEDKEGYTLNQTVLHIQSPTLRTTYIRSPPVGVSGPLGMKHPWIHLQVRNMEKEWSFEVGIVDKAGRQGTVRCSTFQKEPRLKLADPPVLHLPLAFPQPSSRPLTTWSTINLHLPALLPHFSSLALTRKQDEETPERERRWETAQATAAQVPSGTYSHVAFVKVYATCRLRRIYFSEAGPTQELPWEFQLYSGN